MTQTPQLRTYVNEVKRERDLLDRLARIGKLEEGLHVTATEPERYQPLTASMWKGGIEPVSFDEFCFQLDGMYLFEKQADIWDLTRSLRPSHLFDRARTITEWLCILGKGSGKDYIISKFMAWLAFVLHQFAEDPCIWMSANGPKIIAPGTRLDIVNVAPNADLARQVFYEYLKRWLKCPIFNNVPMDPPPDRMKKGTDEIIFPSVNLHLYSKTSKSSGLDGFNLLSWIMDEADEFFDSADKSNADDIHQIFRSTQLSRIGHFGTGFIISYPRYEDGFILRTKERFEKNPSLFFVMLAPTAEVRPDFDRNSPEIIEEFEFDPAGSAAKYDCAPMAGENVFFTNAKEKLPFLIDETREPLCTLIYDDVDVELNNGTKAPYVAAFISDIRKQPGCEYFITADGGHKGDSYAICVGHIDSATDSVPWLCPAHGSNPRLRASADYERLETRTPIVDQATGKPMEIVCGICGGRVITLTPMTGNTGWWRRKASAFNMISVRGQTLELPHVFEDLLIEIKPKHNAHAGGEARPVNFALTYDLIKQLVVALDVVKVRVDPWQLIQLVQTLQAETGVDADILKFGNTDQMLRARLYKTYMEQHMMSLRANATRDREVRRIIQKRSGMGIDHQEGDGESKDVYDSESMLIYTAASHCCGAIDIAFGATSA